MNERRELPEVSQAGWLCASSDRRWNMFNNEPINPTARSLT
jgi:hypothetical protein